MYQITDVNIEASPLSEWVFLEENKTLTTLVVKQVLKDCSLTAWNVQFELYSRDSRHKYDLLTKRDIHYWIVLPSFLSRMYKCSHICDKI